MAGIDYFAWFVLIVIVLSVVAAFIVLAMLPGKTAKKRQHPQAEAINAAAWLGLIFTFGIVWVLAYVWALSKPLGAPAPDDGGGLEALEARVAELEARLGREAPEGAEA